MATKRRRGNSWQYTIRRAGLLRQPVHLSFASESEGDEYVRRLEVLLDRGVLPQELTTPRALVRCKALSGPPATASGRSADG